MSETNPQNPLPSRESDEKLVADYRRAAGGLGRAGGGAPPLIAAAMARLERGIYSDPAAPAPQPSTLNPQPSIARLSNAEARPIAEALYRELAKQYHPSALMKLVGLLDRIHARETKNQQVAYQTQQSQSAADGRNMRVADRHGWYTDEGNEQFVAERLAERMVKYPDLIPKLHELEYYWMCPREPLPDAIKHRIIEVAQLIYHQPPPHTVTRRPLK